MVEVGPATRGRATRFWLKSTLTFDITCDKQPGGWRLSQASDVTLVDSFIRLGDMVDGHVTCGRRPDKSAIFIEISLEVGGRRLTFTEQSGVLSRLHREDGTLQDHWSIWRTTMTQRQKFKKKYLSCGKSGDTARRRHRRRCEETLWWWELTMVSGDD